MVRSFLARDLREPGSEQRSGGLGFEKGAQFAGEGFVVAERIVLRARLEEEIERIEDRHLRDQIHFDGELGGRFGKDEAREIVGLRILLPVDEVVLGLDLSANRRESACGSAARDEAGRPGGRD